MVARRIVHRNQRDKAKTGGGPRTAAGKRRSRLNARRHGLGVPITADPHVNKSLLDLAHFIAGEGADDASMGQALIVAECELALLRIHRARVTTIDTTAEHQDPDQRQKDRKTAEAFARALPDLCTIERYERRIHSRRKRALQNLEGLQVIARLYG